MNTIKKLSSLKTLLAGFLLAGLFSIPAQAQRFVIVDVNAVLESQEEYKNAQADLDQTAATWRQEINQQYDEIRSLYNRYQAEQVLLSDEERGRREEEIMNREKQVRDLQKARFGPEGELFKKRQQLVRPIQDKIYAASEAYANEQGYDFIFDKSGSAGIIFSKPAFDKTEEVMKRLN